MSYNIIKNSGGQYTNISADGTIYTYMNPNGNYVVADALTSPITTEYIGSKITKNIGDFSIEPAGKTFVKTGATSIATFDTNGITLSTGNFVGNASTATTATNATNVNITTDNTSGSYYIPFSKTSGTGNKALFQDDSTSALSYNPSTSTLTATTFSGALSGNATTATTATNATNVATTLTTTGTTYYPTFLSATTGNNDVKVDTALTFNADTNTLTTTTFSGALSGNATTATTATNVNITTDNTSGSYYIPFSKTSGTGNKALFQDDTTTALSYNPSTSTLTATTFSGALSGTATNATNVTITDSTANTTFYPVLSTGISGNQALVVDGSTLPFTYVTSGGIGTLNVRDRIALTDTITGSNAITYDIDPSGNVLINNSNILGNVNIGYNANNHTNQNADCISIGNDAGTTNQGQYAIAIGRNTGKNSQGYTCIAIGVNAGNTSQKTGSVAVGANSGQNGSLGQYAVGLGFEAGKAGTGDYSISIGHQAGLTTCGQDCIIINASSTALNSDVGVTDRCYINPIRSANNNQILTYNTTSKEITYTTLLSPGGVVTSGVVFVTNNSTTYTCLLTIGNTFIFYHTTAGANYNMRLPADPTDGQKVIIKQAYTAIANKPAINIVVNPGAITTQYIVPAGSSASATNTTQAMSALNVIELVYYAVSGNGFWWILSTQ